MYGACWPLQLELVVPLVDLLHRVLHYVILCLAGHHQDHQPPHQHHQNNHINNEMHPGEHLRLLVSPLRHVCPALLVILSGAGASTPQPQRYYMSRTLSIVILIVTTCIIDHRILYQPHYPHLLNLSHPSNLTS